MDKDAYSGFAADPNTKPIEVTVFQLKGPVRRLLVPLRWWEIILAMFGLPVKRRPYTYRVQFEGIFAPMGNDFFTKHFWRGEDAEENTPKTTE